MRRLLLPDRFNCISLLADVATELLTHPDKSTVDVARSRTHASGSCQCYKRDNQQVLDQSLATLVVVKSLQPRNHSRQFVTPVQKLNGFIGAVMFSLSAPDIKRRIAGLKYIKDYQQFIKATRIAYGSDRS